MLSRSFFLAASVLALAAAAPAPTPTTERNPSPAETTVVPGTSLPPSYDNPTNHYCNNFPKAPAEDLTNTFNEYLNGSNKGMTCVGAGPGACKVLASCGHAEISYCNDNPYPKCVDNSDLIIRVGYLGETCTGSGQDFFGDHTNVLFKGI